METREEKLQRRESQCKRRIIAKKRVNEMSKLNKSDQGGNSNDHHGKTVIRKNKEIKEQKQGIKHAPCCVTSCAKKQGTNLVPSKRTLQQLNKNIQQEEPLESAAAACGHCTINNDPDAPQHIDENGPHCSKNKNTKKEALCGLSLVFQMSAFAFFLLVLGLFGVVLFQTNLIYAFVEFLLITSADFLVGLLNSLKEIDGEY